MQSDDARLVKFWVLQGNKECNNVKSEKTAEL